MKYRECELCGATLDHGERCTCREEADAKAREDKAKKQASVIAAMLRQKKKP